jgi:hypothetical protein
MANRLGGTVPAMEKPIGTGQKTRELVFMEVIGWGAK